MEMFLNGFLFGLGFWLAKAAWELFDVVTQFVIEWWTGKGN